MEGKGERKRSKRFLLRICAFTLALVAEGLVTASFACTDHLPQLAALAKRFANRKPDLADLCLIKMSDL